MRHHVGALSRPSYPLNRIHPGVESWRRSEHRPARNHGDTRIKMGIVTPSGCARHGKMGEEAVLITDVSGAWRERPMGEDVTPRKRDSAPWLVS